MELGGLTPGYKSRGNALFNLLTFKVILIGKNLLKRTN